MRLIPWSMAAWIVRTASQVSAPPHIHPPMAQVPKPIRDTGKGRLLIVILSTARLLLGFSRVGSLACGGYRPVSMPGRSVTSEIWRKARPPSASPCASRKTDHPTTVAHRSRIGGTLTEARRCRDAGLRCHSITCDELDQLGRLTDNRLTGSRGLLFRPLAQDRKSTRL